MNIADRVQHLRKIAGLSQEELADKIGVSRQSVSKWESEQSIPDLDKIIILSDIFDVTTDYLLKGIETRKQANDRPVNALIFFIMSTVFNFIGLILAIALWYQMQSPEAVVIGLTFMAVGCGIFGIGCVSSTQKVKSAKRLFLSVNIWILSFIIISIIYNALFSFTIAPYPFHIAGLGRISLTGFAFSVVIYFVICFGAIFWAKRKFAE